jgi:hypothetical protein
LILLLILVVNAAAQFDTGTVIIVGYSRDKIIVVAESRQAGEKGEHFDNGCKITALNDKFFFSASGRAEDMTHWVVGWSAHDQAKEILDATSKESRTARNMAIDWGKIMVNRINRYIRPEEKGKLIPRKVYLTGLCAGISPAGDTEIAEVNVEPVVVNGKEVFGATMPSDNSVEVPPVSDKMNYIVLGREADLFNELFYATSERAKREKAITTKESKKWRHDEMDVRLIVRVMGLILKYSDHPEYVGGPIDAAQLDKGGTIRWIQLLNTNYADLSFLFTILPGEKTNAHLGTEYLAVVETDNSTPYFLNLHTRDVVHTLILGMTGSGKSHLCVFLLQNAQKYKPLTFIFDIGGSFQSLTTIFKGSYLNVGQEARDFTINPFSLPQTKENLQFLFSFFRVLIEGNGQRYRLDFKEERRLWDAIERIYVLEPSQRTISNFSNIIGELKERLHRWTRGGQYGFLFDNAEDTLSFKSFQTFNFHGWNDAPEVLEPLLFYVLHRASNEITDPKNLVTPKFFLFDEAWLFIKNETIRNYVRSWGRAPQIWCAVRRAPRDGEAHPRNRSGRNIPVS